MNRFSSICGGCLLLAVLLGGAPPAAKPTGSNDSPNDAALTERVKDLIQTLGDPEAGAARQNETSKSIGTLMSIGRPAVPALVKVVVEADPRDVGTIFGNKAAYSALVLDKIGEPAVRHVREKWAGLNEAERWKLMRFRGLHDYAAALPFALTSLESKSNDVVTQSVNFLGKYKESQAREPLQKKLKTAAPGLRWEIVAALGAIGGDGVDDALIALLDNDSWAAKGVGHGIPDCNLPAGWPDCRREVIDALGQLSSPKVLPALRAVLTRDAPVRQHLAMWIIPVLGERGDTECLADLGWIADSSAFAIGLRVEAREAMTTIVSRIKSSIVARLGLTLSPPTLLR
jgi:hypothetical protein